MAAFQTIQHFVRRTSPLKLFDYSTQPRFLLPVLFPFVTYLGWLRDPAAPLMDHVLAAIAIALVGWIGAMFVEYQPFVPLEDDTVNDIQGVMLAVVAGLIYVVWNHFGWSDLVQGWALVGAIAVFLWLPTRRLLTLSGGVIFPTAVFVYLSVIESSFIPLLLVPALRVPVALKIENLTYFETVVGLSMGIVSVVIVLVLPSVS
ncbi:hypothetical protein [Haloarcula sp. JP-L23]|uniref:hypothetical protein n=1 Tax=Haloarcula sp. JP-L23 TaxID=2716717 RepID=UPI00140F048B|nr:hypothetical protein G9465_13025 [Haloarcula sp. JP-L23]